MRYLLAALGIIAAAGGYTLTRKQPEPPSVVVAPTPKPHRFAPEGVYYLTQYVSLPTKTGVIGFTPGQPLRSVSREATVWHMTDGSHSLEVDPALLTNDLDIAEGIARGDDQAQAALAAAQAKDAREAQREAAAKAAATPPPTVRTRTVYVGSAPTPANPLDRPAQRTNGGRPVTSAPVFVDQYGNRVPGRSL